MRLHADEASDVNVIGDRLRVYMVLQNGTEYRLGTFLWADASRPLRSWGGQHDSELVDFTYILDQQATQAFSWGRGAMIGLVTYFLLLRAGFTLEDIAVVGEEAKRALADPVSWQPGTTWLTMLTDLGNLCGFAPPWFDRDGLIHQDQPPDPDIAPPTVPSYDTAGRVIADSIVPVRRPAVGAQRLRRVRLRHSRGWCWVATSSPPPRPTRSRTVATGSGWPRTCRG